MPGAAAGPRLSDPRALAAHRARAARIADDSAQFLHAAARDEVEEKLKDVNRTFTAPAVVTAHPGLWGDVAPEARVVPPDEVLDLSPGAQDLIVHAMCLHWADDPVGQLIQCARALRPDGLLIAALPGGETLHELRAALGQAEIELCGGLSPRVVPTGELRDMAGLLQRAGLALPVADLSEMRVRYRDIAHLARDLRAMGETSALAQRRREVPPRGLFPLADRIYRDAFPDGDGIAATFQTIYLTGWAPSADQPRPLRPGSAQVSLADVLGRDDERGER